MKYLKNLSIAFVCCFFFLGSAQGDDFVPLENISSTSFEIRDSYIDLDIFNSNLFSQDSFFTLNSCSNINANKNLLFLNPKIPFSYCHPSWLVLSFTVPSDWEPGTNIFLELNWFTLENSVLGNSSFKYQTQWKLFYKILDDKMISSFDLSIPSNYDDAINNLLESLKSFKMVNFTSMTPDKPNTLTSTGKNLVISHENIISNKSIQLIIYREVNKLEDKFFPGINLQSARIIYSKKHLK